MIVPILTSQAMVSALVEVCFYLERAIDNLIDIDAKIKCNNILEDAKAVLSYFVQFYEEKLPPPPYAFWNQIVKR